MRSENMKKCFSVIALVMMAVLVTSCGNGTDIEVDSNQIYGKWHDGTLYERYDVDGTGATWDLADDVTEEEAQRFSWTLNGNRLLQEHQGEMSFVVYKEYTVNRLNAFVFSYEDEYGFGHSFVRAN